MATTEQSRIAETQRNLDRLLDEIEAGQKEMEQGPLPEARGLELDEKASEAAQLQAELDRHRRLKAFERTPAKPTVPRRAQPSENGGLDGEGGDEAKIVGRLNVGEYFVRTKAYRDYIAQGMPKAGSSAVTVPALDQPLSLTRDQVKSLPDIGPDVLVPVRDPDRVRDPEMDRLVIRDLLNVSRTGAPAVSYVVYKYTEAAKPTAEAQLKPEAGETFGTALAPVRTIAVWIPVTEQMLEDFAALAGIINTDLLYDVRRNEEWQIVWGDGTGENLLGLLNPATGVPEIPALAKTDRDPQNVIEAARMGITDVILRGGQPNGIVMHPIDWEAVELTKGSDAHYIWTVETTRTIQGGLVRRLWGTTVVESVAMAEPADMANPSKPADPTSRHLLVGDFIRGATLWDRRLAGISTGWINDQFVKNMRTIRAEERLAFGTKRPHFFATVKIDPEWLTPPP